MALNITINKTAVAASYPAGSTVATVVASGGTTPYTYSLATGGDYFSIDASTGVVTTKALMDASSIQSFSVTATDSNSTPESITSGVVYPNIQAAQQSKFNKSNVIYKIVNDIDLGNAVLTIPANCTLDFQGGSFSNGTIYGEKTIIIAPLIQIFGNELVLSGTFLGTGYVEYYGCYPNNQNNDVCIAITKIYKGFQSVQLQDGTYYTSTGHCPITNLRGVSKYTTSILYVASNDNDYLFSLGDMDNLKDENYRKRYLSLSDMQIVMKSQNDTKLHGCSVIKFGNIADSYLRHMMISCYQKGLLSSQDELKSTIEDESLEESFNSVLRFTGYSEILSFDDLRILGTVPVKSDYSSQLDATNFQNCIFIGGNTGYANVLLKGSIYNVSFTGFCSFNQFLYGLKCTKSVWNLSINGARFEQPLTINDNEGKQISCNIYINPKDYRIRLGLANLHLAGEANGIYLDGSYIEADISNVYTFTDATGSTSKVHLQYGFQIGSNNKIGLITTHNVNLPTSDVILKDWGIVRNSVINFYGTEYRAIHSIRDAVICNQVYSNIQNKGFIPYDNNRTLIKYRHTTILKAGGVYTVNELSPTSWKLGISTAKCEGVAIIKDGDGNNVKSLGFSFLIDKNADHHFLYKSENSDANYNIRFGEEPPKGQRLVIPISQSNNKWNVSFMSSFDDNYHPDYTIEIFFIISLYSSYTTWLIQDVEWS